MAAVERSAAAYLTADSLIRRDPGRGGLRRWVPTPPLRSGWLEGRRCTTLNIVNARVRRVVDEFLELTPDERELAIAELEASDEGQEAAPEEVEKAWAPELERRIEDVVEGRAQTRDVDDALAELRARYARR